MSPLDGLRNTPRLQRVLWAPNNHVKMSSVTQSLIQTQSAQLGGTVGIGMGKTISQAIAFVYDNDLYYKPKVQSDLVCRITNTGEP